MRARKEVKAVKRLIWAKVDVQSARELAEKLIKDYEEVSKRWGFRAIQSGIVVSYARPFGENHGLGTLPQKFREFAEPRLQLVHDNILRTRDVLDAHNNLLELKSVLAPSVSPGEEQQVTIEIHDNGQIGWTFLGADGIN